MIYRKSGMFFRRNTLAQILIISVIFIGFFYGISSFFGTKANVNKILHNAKTLTLQGNFDLSMNEYKKAINLMPEEPLIYDGIGFLYLNKEDTEKAKENYNIAMSKGLKFNKMFDHKKIGFEYIDKGRYTYSLIEFRHYLQLKPYDYKGYLGLGLSLHALGNINLAIETYQKALKLAPNNKELEQFLNKAQKEKDKGTTTYIYDRNLVPLLKKTLDTRVTIYSGESYTDKIIGYNDEKYKKLGLEAKMSDIIQGNEITLTIDLNMQKIASSALRDKIGAVVILRPQTGEILAAVSHPKFDPNKMEKNWLTKYKYNKNNVFLNRAFESLYEPGSICKIITTSAFLESRLSSKDIFPVKCNGLIMIDNSPFWCWQKHGIVKTLEQAVNESCNIAFEKIGTTLGNDKLYEYANKFGFNTPINLQLPIMTSTLPLEVDNKYEVSERANGLGKTYRITPLQAALMVATIANDGVLMKPYLIKEIKNIKGDIIYQETPISLKTTLKHGTANALKKLMVEAVENGLGKKAKVHGVQIAGKTGTAKTGKKGLDGWFVCFAPAETPKIAIAILCEQGGKGMDVAAPIAKTIISEILLPR